MSKEKKRTRASTSCSVIDSSDLEQSTIPTEFTEFVRSAFEKMSVKMDNIITGQQALEIKLDLVNQQVQSNKGEIEELKKSADFVCEQLTKATCVTKENAKKTADIDKDVDFLMTKMQSLEAEVNATERYSRSYNARFLGMPEETGEQCASVVNDLLRNKLGQSGQAIENAHRIGKTGGGQPRQIIVRFFSRQTRAEVFRAARAGLRQDGIRIVDDLTRVDWQEKRRVQPLMNKLYKENKRPFFRNGRLYAENRPVPFGLIDNFLSSEEGRAATK